MKKITLRPDDIRVEPLTERNRDYILNFSSSVCQELDAFLKENAFQEHILGFSKTYLYFYSSELAGYVTILTDKQTLRLERAHPDLQKFQTKTENGYTTIPALKIGRMCVSDNFNSQLETAKYCGLGKIMFASILDHARELSTKVGCRVITTHAKKSTGAYLWYQKLGFIYSHNEEKTKELLAKEEYDAIPMFYDLKRIRS